MHHTLSLTGSADALASHMDDEITRGSISATLEHADELSIGDARMILRTYERYSFTGSNRVTLSMSILTVGNRVEVALSTSGGSEGMFLKLNTFGESAFMDKALQAIEPFTRV